MYGTDPFDPKSFPTGKTLPLSGESDGISFSLLNASEGTQPIPSEVDGVSFSVYNGSQGTQPIPSEADGVSFSVYNGSQGTQPIPSEADGILFSVLNKASSAKAKKAASPLNRGGREPTLPTPYQLPERGGVFGAQCAGATRRSVNRPQSEKGRRTRHGAPDRQRKFEKP